MKKIFITLLAVGGLFVSCDLDRFPNDKISPEGIKSNPVGAEYATIGNYAMFKDRMEYKGSEYTGNTYVRHYFQMAEFMGDNNCLGGRTSDPLYEATTYKRTSDLRNITYLWWSAYRIINGANAVIESVDETSSPYLKGENYFLRANAYFNLITLWAKPYYQGTGNPGVILNTSSETSNNTRATVGQVYDRIVADLLEAIKLMDGGVSKAPGRASKVAAQALLSRVYLYMGKNDEVIKLVNNMLGDDSPASKLTPSSKFPNYYATANTDKVETIWAIIHTVEENRGSSSIASMYITDGSGWGEVFASDPLLDLLNRYPEDLRHSFIKPKYINENIYVARWTVPGEEDFLVNQLRDLTKDGSRYYFMEGSSKVYIETEKINGYNRNYIMLNGVKTTVRVDKKMQDLNKYPKYFVSKFSYQDGISMLSSPVMLRWAEVILNRAEAYAKNSDKEKALDDVNVIRTRAGLSGDALFSTNNMHGYTNLLDIVLDERRMELSFEGHRAFDVYRNGKKLDRRYAGVQAAEIVEPTDPKTQYYIPQDEILVSGIPQNP